MYPAGILRCRQLGLSEFSACCTLAGEVTLSSIRHRWRLANLVLVVLSLSTGQYRAVTLDLALTRTVRGVECSGLASQHGLHSGELIHTMKVSASQEPPPMR